MLNDKLNEKDKELTQLKNLLDRTMKELEYMNKDLKKT